MLRKRFVSLGDKRGNECVLVAKTIASSIETLLGNGKSLKCCESSGTSILTSSTPKILETIDIQHPAGFIINSACQSFQKEFGCGSTTLICLIGYWAGALQNVADMGVPVTVMAGILNEIADELENILQRSCISLKTIREIDLQNSKSHENISSQGTFKSMYNVSDKCVEYPRKKWDKNTTSIKDDPVNNVELSTLDVTENHQTFSKNHTLHKYEFAHGNSSQSNSQLSQPCKYSVPKDSSPDYEFSTRKETDECITEDEFDCCFDELTTNKGRPRHLERPFSTSNNSMPCKDNIMKTIIAKKPSLLFDERKFGNNGLELNEMFGLLNFTGTSNECGNVGRGLNWKQDNVKMKSSGINHSDLNKNVSDLVAVSSKKLSIHRDIVNEVLASKTNSKTDVKNVIRRSRHLTNQSTLGSECSDINRIMDQSHSKVTEIASTENYENKVKQSSFKINYESFKNESKSTYLASCRESKEDWLNFLGRSLAHGKESEMSLALEIFKRQFPFSEVAQNEFSFHSDLISVQTIIGPPTYNSCVLEGIVVELSKENQSTAVYDSNTPKKIALVKGDITHHYRHPGFKDSIKVTRTLNKDDLCSANLNSQSEWISRVMQLVKTLNLGVIAVLGHVTMELRDYLQALGVIVFEHLNNHQLDVLSKMTGAPIVSYILDITLYDLGKPVVVRIWDMGWSSSRHSAKSRMTEISRFGQICLWSDKQSVQKLKSVVYSVVLCGPVQDLVNDTELKFWNCVHRLRNAFENQCVLPGGGDIERICVKQLEDIRDCKSHKKAVTPRWITDEYDEFRGHIIDAVSSGLEQFVATTNYNIVTSFTHQVSMNSDLSAIKKSITVYDNYTCKVEGWKRAIRIVKLFFNAEHHIVTGM